MTSFRQICSITVTHGYFSGARCRCLEFVPLRSTQRLIGKAGLILKKNNSGLQVFLESGTIDLLRQRIEDPDETSALVFKVFPKDPVFPYYTEPDIFNEEALLYFDNRKAGPSRASFTRLHSGEYVSVQEFEKFDSPLFLEIVEKQDRLIRPAFIVSLDLSLALGALSETKETEQSGDYVVAFRARETFWRYNLLGEMKKSNAFILDRNNGSEFVCMGEEQLPGGRTALTFISKRPISLRKQSDCFFQLKEKGTGGEKILIKRLPVATPDQFRREVVNGQEAAVSDIYINC